jgi:flavodoxin
MKALVTYHSETGNTAKLAREIFAAIDIGKELVPLETLENPEGYDVIFCGFPVHARGVPAKVHAFFKKLPPGQKIAFFSTHGSLTEEPLSRRVFEHVLELANGANVIGIFSSRGVVDAKLLEAIRKQPEHRAWAEEARDAEGHPDDADLAGGRAFAAKMINLIRQSV